MSTKAVTPELLADQVRVSDPQMSGDGSFVVFVAASVSRTDRQARSAIWRARHDGGAEHQLTNGQAEDKEPCLSRDGRLLAFTSDRMERGKSQLLVMALDGGEPVAITSRRSSVSAPAWSPDHDLIAFLSADEAPEGEDRDKSEGRDHVVVDEEEKRTRLYVSASDGSHQRRLSPRGAAHVWAYCWAPDGRRLAAVVTPGCGLDEHYGPNRVLVIDLEGRSDEVFRFPSGVSRLRWSPDGRHIAFLAKQGRVNAQDQLYLANVESGVVRPVISGYGGSISDMQWLPDGRRLLFVGQENLHGALNVVEWSDGSVRSVLPANLRSGAFDQDLSIDHSGSRYAVVWSEPTKAPEVFGGAAEGSVQQVSHRAESLAEVPFRPVEELNWLSSDGTEIWGLTILPEPARYSPPYPTVLVIHGGPASAFAARFHASWHDWSQLLAAHGYAVIMPNPRGSIGRGPEFTDAEVGDIGGLELEDDLRGLDLLIERGLADPNRLAVCGWSHGGYMTAWTVTQTDRFKAAVMGAGLANLVSDQGTNDIPSFNLDYMFEGFQELYDDPSKLWERSPLKHVRNVKTPTLILHGEKDERVAVSQGREFFRALRSLKVPSAMVIYPREPHSIREREHQIDLQNRILDWFDRYVKVPRQT